MDEIVLLPGWEHRLRQLEAKEFPPQRIEARLQGEAEARDLLTSHLGALSEADVAAFLAALSKDFWGGQARVNRFMPAFYGSLSQQVSASTDAFNRWSERLWAADDHQLDQVLDEFWAANEVAGAGTSLPTVLLYLKDPEKYAVWLPVIQHGVHLITKSPAAMKNRTATGYRQYNHAVQSLRSKLQLAPQKMDALLVAAYRSETQGPQHQFEELFEQFSAEFLDSSAGRSHLARYAQQRTEASASYQQILTDAADGKDVTDDVLRLMLPHADTQGNRSRQVWIHIAPAVTRDLREWFEGAKWTRPEQWPEVAASILEFVRRCLDAPERLAEHCEWFAQKECSNGFQMGLMTPILNALAPDAYNILNNKPRKVLNALYGENYSNQLTEYPTLNALHFQTQEKHAGLIDAVRPEGILRSDVLDAFCHWVVSIRKLGLKETDAYKVSPGDQAKIWDECRDDGYIAVGWSVVGDLTGVSKEEFSRRCDEALKSHPTWTKRGMEQLWRFARIKDGDRIVANRGKTEVLGFGVVTGSYYFVEGAEFGHRLPVLWDDVVPRRVNEPSWSTTVQKLTSDRFERLRDGELMEESLATDGATLTPAPLSLPPSSSATLCEDYTLETCAEETGFPQADLERWVAAIDRKRQGVFFGPPGTGKTYLAEKLARHLVGGGDGFIEFVQFHPEYAYQDFVQGIRPELAEGGGVTYKLVDGVFKRFCAEASRRTGRCVLIIDEINRANLSRVFGELMYLLEYRDKQVELASGGAFQIPANVRLIGAMNTADRSIALVDYALRRRFAFIQMAPNLDVLRSYHADSSFDVEGLIRTLKRLNAEIADSHYEIGVSYFLIDNLADEIEDVWRMEIEPYLDEYFFDSPARAKSFGWTAVAGEIAG